MNKEILIFNDIVIDKRKFHYSKNPIFIDNVDIDKILISKRFLLVKRVKNALLVTKIMSKWRYCV